MPCGPTNPANISTPVNWLLLEHKLIHFGSVWQLSRYNVRNESLWENMIHKDENIYSLPRFWKFASPWYVLNGGSGLIAKLYLTLCNPMDYSPPSLSEGFPRWEYWSGLPCPPQEDLPDPAIKPGPPTLQVDSLLTEPSDPSHFMNGVGGMELVLKSANYCQISHLE